MSISHKSALAGGLGKHRTRPARVNTATAGALHNLCPVSIADPDNIYRYASSILIRSVRSLISALVLKSGGDPGRGGVEGLPLSGEAPLCGDIV